MRWLVVKVSFKNPDFRTLVWLKDTDVMSLQS